MPNATAYPDAPADFEDLAQEEFVFGTGTDGAEPCDGKDGASDHELNHSCMAPRPLRFLDHSPFQARHQARSRTSPDVR